MTVNDLCLLCLHPSLESSRPLTRVNFNQNLNSPKAALLKTRVPETTKACKQALFYLPALISSVYITVTVALHKVN